jgi:hypothetical protein
LDPKRPILAGVFPGVWRSVGTLEVTWGDSGIGRAAGQSNLPTGAFDDIAFIIVPFDDAPDILDVVGQAGDDEVHIIGHGRAPHENFVACKCYEHCVFNIVIQGPIQTGRIDGMRVQYA